MNRTTFIKTMVFAAKSANETMKYKLVSPFIAIAIYKTNFGDRITYKECKNCFDVEGHGKKFDSAFWGGVKKEYRTYETEAESFTEFMERFKGRTYELKREKDYKAFCNKISKYTFINPDDIINIIESYNLTQYDK